MTGFEVVAGALYFLPVVLVASFLVATSTLQDWSRGPSAQGILAKITLAVPAVLALDTLLVLLLTFVMPLGKSAVVARALWVAGYVALLVLRRGSLRFAPFRPALRPLAVAAVTSVLAVWPFLETSYTLNAWDRDWHVPLATSIQGQTLPFENVFEPARLRYHYLGDVVAAMLRQFTGNALSSATALSLSHDLFLGLAAGWLASLVLSLGRHRLAVAVFGGIGLALHGPMLRTLNGEYDGYAYHPFSRLSYRPHVPIALFAMTSFVGTLGLLASRSVHPDPLLQGTVWQRLAQVSWQPRATLMASMMLLALTDETSSALCGAAMAFVWLFNPRLIAERRGWALLWLVVLAVALIVPNFTFTASLAPGGPVQQSAWVAAPRLASVATGEIPLSELDNQKLLALVMAPVLCCVFVLGLSVFRTRRRGRVGAFVFPCAVACLAVTFGTLLTINGTPSESQRFFVFPYVAAIVMTVAHVPAMRASRTKQLAIALASMALIVPALYTLYYLPYQLRTVRVGSASGAEMGTAANKFWPLDLYRVDCRRVAGAPFFERTEPVYVDETGYTTYASCRPIHSTGYAVGVWPLPIYPTIASKKQLRGLLDDRLHPVRAAVCLREGAIDPFCQRLKAKGDCTRAGRMFLRCEFRGQEAIEYLSTP